MWRQHSAKRNNHENQGSSTTGLAPLDPNFNAATNNNNNSNHSFINMSKQSIDVEKSNVLSSSNINNPMMMPSGIDHHHLTTQNSLANSYSYASSSAATPYPPHHHQQLQYNNNNNLTSTSAFVSTAPAPAVVNHRDRFQVYLERYAPNHPETAMRRAQLLHKNAEQSAIDPIVHRHPAVEQVAQSLNHNNNNNTNYQYYDPVLENDDGPNHNNNNNKLALLKVVAEHSSTSTTAGTKKQKSDQNIIINNNQNNKNNNTIVEDIEANSVSVLDVRPDRLRFELCAARSENDQLKKRISTLQNMNDHLRDKLEEAMLSEREQVVRANSIENQDRSLQERLADAESEIRELRRRLGESDSALAQTETKLAQARGRLAAFDHIANDFSTSNINNNNSSNPMAMMMSRGHRSSTRSDSTTELTQTLSTSHYLLSVLSVLRFWFNLHHQKIAETRPDMGIVVHVGGGLPPMNIASLAHATEALQTLICGNRETDSEMRTRVVGWTPDDILREIRSVTMTCETMIVRLLTDGAVGTMLRKTQQQEMQQELPKQNENLKHQLPVVAVSTNSLQYYAPVASRNNNAKNNHVVVHQNQNLQNVVVNQVQSPSQNLMGVADSKYEEEAWLQQERQEKQQQQRLADNNQNDANTESPIKITAAPRRTVDVSAAATTLHSPPRQQQQQQQPAPIPVPSHHQNNSINVSSRNIQPTYYQVDENTQRQQENRQPPETNNTRSSSALSNRNSNSNGMTKKATNASNNNNTENNSSSSTYQKEMRQKQQAEREKAEMARLRTFGSLMGDDDDHQNDNNNGASSGFGEPCAQQ